MDKVVLISCVSKKKKYTTEAENLYDSPFFKYSLRYAKSLKPDKILILSALYGVVELKQLIEPYNKTLNKMKVHEKKEWSKKVLSQLIQKDIDFNNDEFVILAGKNYRNYIVDHFKNYIIPMEGLTIGKQLSFLKRSVENEQ